MHCKIKKQTYKKSVRTIVLHIASLTFKSDGPKPKVKW